MDAIAPRRPHGLEEMNRALAGFWRAGEAKASLEGYRPRPTDVIIAPYGKCGTTWLQQIFHTLRTRGDMDFDDISRVVPWIETAAMLGLDLEAPQRAGPRGFKSHMAHDAIPKGARYVVSLRDPADALVSMYHFQEGWFFEPGTISLEDFAAARLAPNARGDYWSHLLSWWAARDSQQVLLLSYEQMLADPAGTIRRVAAFSGLALDDELLALTLERSSIGFMLAHKDRFDDAMMRRLSEARCNLPPGSDSAKVRKGGSGGGREELPAEVRAALDALWAERVAPVTGYADYAALAAALPA